MKKIKIDVSRWVQEFIHAKQHPGHVDTSGIDSYAIRPSAAYLSSEMFSLLPQKERSVLSDTLEAQATTHHLNEIAIAMWASCDCWHCKTPYTPHSIVSKNASLIESIEVETGLSGRGIEKVGVVHPEIEYNGSSGPIALMPYAAEAMDKILLQIWMRFTEASDVLRLVTAKPAGIEYKLSKAYGGNYWGLTCPNCSELQEESFLKPHSGQDEAARANAPMASKPILLAIPSLKDTKIGGKVVSRILFVDFP